MANIKVLLISILKPIDDTRMYEKIGMALAKIEKAEVHIAGFTANKVPVPENIEFHPLFSFNRLSIRRLASGWKALKLMIKVKPEIVIPNTHELLIVTVLYKIFFGCRILYDVQENYFRNLWYGKQFPWLIKHFLALYVRFKEWVFSPFIESFLLAEQCYLDEIPLMRRKAILIENKFKKPPNFVIPDARVKSPLKLLYTGIIADLYGINDVINLAEDLLKQSTGTLTIAGYCPENQLLNKIRNRISRDERIILIGGDRPVPHQVILDKISESNLALTGYKNNPSLSNKIPTRFYEYAAYQLPFILPENPIWTKWASQYNAGIAINFDSYNPEEILENYITSNFYSPQPGKEIYFDSEETTLQNIINKN